MAELKEEGKVRHIGVSNFDVSQMERANAIAPVETLQPPYNMLNRDVEERYCPTAARTTSGSSSTPRCGAAS
jgi:aryl-alcohol dehydrogenase-like predicted oxidoreductase